MPLLAFLLSFLLPSALSAQNFVKHFGCLRQNTDLVFTLVTTCYCNAEATIRMPSSSKDESPKSVTRSLHLGRGPGVLRVPLPLAGDDEGATDVPKVEYEIKLHAFEYQALPPVGRLGRGELQFSAPNHLSMGRQGRIMVVDGGNDRIQVLRPDLSYETEFGGFAWDTSYSRNEVSEMRFDEPWDSVFNSNQEIYVTDRNNARVVRCTLSGRFIEEFRLDNELRRPAGMHHDLEGNLYICDTERDRIVVLDLSGRHLYDIGRYGWGREQFQKPQDLFVSRNDILFVADTGNRRIQVLSRTGRFQSEIRTGLRRPVAVWADSREYLYVVDSASRQVTVFDRRLERVETFPREEDGIKLRSPADVLVTDTGQMLVLDRGSSRIERWSRRERVFHRRGMIRIARP